MDFDKNIAELKAQVEQSETNQQGRIYTDDLKKAVVNYHYLSGKTFTLISQEIGVHLALIGQWKKKFGKEKTGFAYGPTIRNDVRTKALCVQEHIEKTISKKDLAHAYNVTEGTVHSWIMRYEHNYKELLDTRDGVPYIVEEKKMVFGNANIELVLELKEKHMTELSHIIEILHEQGLTPGKTLIKEIKAKKEKAQKEIKTLKEAEKILKDVK